MQQQQDTHQQMLCFSSSTAPKSKATLHSYFNHLPAASAKNTGYHYGSNSITMGVRGPFTPSQWVELEHQALIYKYMTANLAIPSNLIIPIKKAMDSAGLSSFSGWGSVHLGFPSANNDPEPGRCRRTDGKKWRCSKDAVADQKYCERHMNRGRHRSRKPVEGRSGNAAAAAAVRLTHQVAASSSSSSSSSPAGATPVAVALTKENPNPFSPSASPRDFGFVSSEPQHPLRCFMDDWPKTNDCSAVSWPGMGLQSESDRATKMTLSPLRLSREVDPIQMGLGLGNPTNVINEPNWGSNSKLWEASSVGGPLGEALHNTNGHSSGRKSKLPPSSSATAGLNLMTAGWDGSPRRVESSPTGVLHKTAFGYLSNSNSSAGSSPSAEKHFICSSNDLFSGSTPTLLSASSMPYL